MWSSSRSTITLFFFNDTATTEIYTLSLHDALPICGSPCQLGHCAVRVPAAGARQPHRPHAVQRGAAQDHPGGDHADRKSTRLNSSHSQISYAVFCLKKKNTVNFERETGPYCHYVEA